jgi:PPK2 family polyphosphate:nucleotide phosphotransferase
MPHAAELDPRAFLFPTDPTPGKAGALGAYDPAGTGPFANEDDAREATERGAKRLGRLVHRLKAHGTHGVVVVIQGMDAAGKDEAIQHVMAAADPGSAHAHSFPRPSGREARYDYLRRAARGIPERGQLAVFNRSYYEQVVADRVHPENLEDQHLPAEILRRAEDGTLWEERFRQIRDYERYLDENGIVVVKLFLNVSSEAQRDRLLERVERPEKRWDFDLVDVTERERWDDYLAAYQAAFRATSRPRAPWYIVPADHKWFARAATAAIVIDRLEGLYDGFPEPDADQREALEEGRRRLEAES